MPRGAFLALAWAGGRGAAPARAAAIAARLEGDGSPGWRRVHAEERLIVWTTGESPPLTVLPGQAGFVVGDLFAKGADGLPRLEAAPCADPARMARWLCAECWGRYVALLQGPRDECPAVFRDPSGLVDCLTWSEGDALHAVASDMRRIPGWLWPPHAFLNWDRIARFVAVPSAWTTEPLLDEINAVGPGELRALSDRRPAPQLVWRPSDHIGSGPIDLAACQRELVRRVDGCAARLADRYDALIVELSGGLDSAIVAGALHATGHSPRVAQWLNRAGVRAEGDERAYARSVTDRMGAHLTTVVKPLIPLTAADFAELADAFWPAMNGADAWRDRDEVERLRATGARGLVSGQGGDAVFFQLPTALVAADEFRRQGLATLASPLLADVARRTRQSVWRVIGEVIAERRGRRAPAMPPSSLVTREVRAAAAGDLHAWARDAREFGAPPGKALQIQGLANHHLYHGDSRRRRIADPLFPLLAQPVLELGLSIPIPDLARGGEDRPFARAAFAERLPDMVRRRRRKGDLTAYFAQLVAASLDALRPLLLDGCLCDAGVLDRDAVDRMLDPTRLIWEPRASEVLWAATVESWVRHWQTRVPDSLASPRRSP